MMLHLGKTRLLMLRCFMSIQIARISRRLLAFCLCSFFCWYMSFDFVLKAETCHSTQVAWTNTVHWQEQVVALRSCQACGTKAQKYRKVVCMTWPLPPFQSLPSSPAGLGDENSSITHRRAPVTASDYSFCYRRLDSNWLIIRIISILTL